MSGEQLRLEFDELEPTRRDPFACEHVLRTTGFKPARTVCGLHGGEVYTNCRQSICGEEPRCVYEPADNSPEAMARRREWMKMEGDDEGQLD